MKTRTLLITIFLLTVVIIFTAGGTKKEISVDEAIEAFSYTWINPDNAPEAKLVVYPDGTMSVYSQVDMPLDTPHYTYKYTIHEAWTDSDGNIWFKSTHKYGVETWYQINTISESGNVWEYDVAYVDLSNLPDEINPDANMYVIYYRQ
jgi:hypothetical protein